jgi:hypothetical protein
MKIKLNGKEYGIKFNQLAIEKLHEYNDGETTSGFMYAMVYGGMIGYSRLKREDVDYTWENVCEWVDEMEDKNEQIQAITILLNETKVWNDLIKQGQEIQENDKKKVIESNATITSSLL